MKLPSQSEPVLRIPMPVKGSVGLGDVIKSATQKLGIDPCQGCQRRAAALNRLVTFSPWKSQG